LVFPRLKKIILVHGCFWHQHQGCRDAHVPKSRTEYWSPKLRRNRERDDENSTRLLDQGWQVLVVWECETQDSDTLAVRLRGYLAGA
jgi:DNA mismatch endonuclease (patch repair protein)